MNIPINSGSDERTLTEDEPYRVLYAFDPRRVALLLIGGCKTGDDSWYEKYVPIADKLLEEHLKSIR